MDVPGCHADSSTGRARFAAAHGPCAFYLPLVLTLYPYCSFSHFQKLKIADITVSLKSSSSS
jgi:hypothetical protein